MAENTRIQWADHSWNPWQGCHKVSAGCANCYMYREKKSYGQNPAVVVRSKTVFKNPLKWHEPAKVFTCSWSDFFIEDADPWRSEAWDIMRRTSHLTYQVLTKRPENIKDRLPADWFNGWPNVWLGISAENQEMLDLRWPYLKSIPAAAYFISHEPALGPLTYPKDFLMLGKRAQIITGGETGPKARPMHPKWAKYDREQAAAFGVPFFFKHWGEWVQRENIAKGYIVKSSSQLGHFDNAGRFVMGTLISGMQHMVRVGKCEEGYLLDGSEYRGFPEVTHG
jgi:protein gp37